MTKFKLVALLLASATLSASGGTQMPNPCKHALEKKAVQNNFKQVAPVGQAGPNEGATERYSSETLQDRYRHLQEMASHDQSIQIVDMGQIRLMTPDCCGDEIASSQ
jgi:TolA-binding protein